MAPVHGSAGAGRPLWVSVEGLNGVGKTEAIRAVSAQLAPACLRLDEVTDAAGESMAGAVIAALSRRGDVFLRSGHPASETLALLALKVREHELLTRAPARATDLILEDRGPDTVAVYQAAILAAADPREDPVALARRIQHTAALFRPAPDVTILMLEDKAVATRRFAARYGLTLRGEDFALIDRVEALYGALAAAESDRFVILDVTGYTRAQAAHALGDLCRRLISPRPVAHV